MSWLELSFETDKSKAELCSEKLETLGAVSVSFFDAGDVPVLEPKPGATPLWNKVKMVGLFTLETNIKQVQKALQHFLPNTTFCITPLEEQDWTRTWLQYFQPIKFGEKLWIIPTDSPLPDDNDAVIVRLDPGLAFGTGTHATTALCLEWLDAHPPLSQNIIDYGCGSGILAIAALKLGASHAFAIDYDPQALTATDENCLRNNIEPERLTACFPEDMPCVSADTVIANILAEPLIQLAPKIQARCALNGNLVLSGLLTKQVDMLRKAYEPWFSFEEIRTQEDWALLWGIKIRSS